eukprot:TRINITY_DN996_c2_g1_i1.p1 TRINITY_DN996_c2_g1~~TRINITY_DN996_c2_g1_i1.p1  ORF type:complete len:502 (-),score=60.13 TRINITY_DN996_c2_g1_i1:432-1937(-)
MQRFGRAGQTCCCPQVLAPAWIINDMTEEHADVEAKRRKIISYDSFYGRRDETCSVGNEPVSANQHFDTFPILWLSDWHRNEFEFATQEQSFRFLSQRNDLDAIFSKDVNSSGKRTFIATSRRHFWVKYKDLFPHERCYYEVIRNGIPCRLYFDLEFPKETNPHANGDALVNMLLCAVFEQLYADFGVHIDRTHVIDLDSTSDTKFSRHLVIHVPNALFLNNLHVGYFVRKLLQQAELQAYRDGVVHPLQVLDVHKQPTTIVDVSVYSKNRNFRLYKSAKYGKQAFLLCAPQNQFPFESEEELFMASLIATTAPAHIRLLCCDPIDIPAHGPPRHPSGAIRTGSTAQLTQFPQVDNFVRTLIHHGGVQGALRSWIYYQASQTIVYNVVQNRWCGNVQRPHKSNGIYIVADLLKRCCVQKCYDPQCATYRSPPVLFPGEIVLQVGGSDSGAAAVSGGGDVPSGGAQSAEEASEVEFWTEVINTADGEIETAFWAEVINSSAV